MGGWVLVVANSKKLDQLCGLDKKISQVIAFSHVCFENIFRVWTNYIFLSCIFNLKATCKSFENIKDSRLDLTQENKAYFICNSKFPIF